MSAPAGVYERRGGRLPEGRRTPSLVGWLSHICQARCGCRRFTGGLICAVLLLAFGVSRDEDDALGRESDDDDSAGREELRRRSDVGGTAVGWAHYSRGANPQTSSQSV